MKKSLWIAAAAATVLTTSLSWHGSAAVAAAAAPSASTATARVIVKYRADSPVLRRQAAALRPAEVRARALGERVGLGLSAGRALGERTQVVYARGMTSAQLAARLAKESDVEYAQVDKRRHAHAVVNDPLYQDNVPPIVGQTGGPVVGQWYLHAPAGEAVASIDAPSAWSVTTGNAAIVVAVLDTGIRFDHPDLKTVANSGVLLPGYDMVGADQTRNGGALGTYDTAADGDGRDADASDPGDWITEQQANDSNGPYYQCTSEDPDDPGHYVSEDSSWHGTQVAGLIGALTDNGVGMASVARGVRVLPVRVLGKCGGYDSDIAAGIEWAIGNAVDGVPANPNPARVVNMSLGGVDDECPSVYQDAVSDAIAKGVVVVASAGNDEGHAVNTPANCPGVVAVAGLRHVGSKVGFSDIGPEVALSAPAGNCVNLGADEPCLYPILTTSNTGLTTPVSDAAGGSIYTDAFRASLGTSFSSPLVAGTAALMLSTQPALTAAEVLSKLQSTARPFPTSGGSSGTPACAAPSENSQGDPVDQDECYCTTATCGAGMLDAGAAVTAANGVQARIEVTSGDADAGTPVALSAASSLIKTGHSIVSYRWQVTDSGGIVSAFIGATDGATATITPTAGGTFTVRLTAVDDAGVTSTASSDIQVAGAAPPSGGGGGNDDGGGGGGALGWGWLAMLAVAVAALCALRLRRHGRWTGAGRAG